MDRNKKTWLGNETQRVLDEFKQELMRRLEPVVLNLVGRLRAIERDHPGKGIEEIDKMLEVGDINQSMYDILLPALENLDTTFEFKLAKEAKKDLPTKLG